MRPWRDLFSPAHRAVTLALCLGEGTYAFNGFFVSVAMPSAVRELGGVRFVAWAVTVYLVAALVTGSATGFLKQRFGARGLLLAASAVFAAGCVCAGLAGSMASVLAGRALQGAGEGVIAAACYALIADLLPAALVPSAFALSALVWALAAFAGPVLGGALTEFLSWRAAFLVSLPVIALFAALVVRTVPATAGSGQGALPFGRLMVIAAGIMAVAVAAVTRAAGAAAVLAAAGLGALALAFLLDRRARVRLFPAAAFDPRTVLGAGLWAALLMPLGQASTSSYLPISIQAIWHWTPVAAGVLVSMMALSWSGSAVLVPLLRGRGRGACIRLGPLLVAAGLAGAAVAVPRHWPVLLVACQVLMGVGFGLGWALLNQAVVAAAGPGEQDLAAALVPTTQNAGYAIGAALTGLAANASGYADALAAGTGGAQSGLMFGAGALVALAGFGLGWRAGRGTG